jgi:sacsin
MQTYSTHTNQRVDLTSYLKNVVRDYGENDAVFRELLQNADDAGASQCTFILDGTQYG